MLIENLVIGGGGGATLAFIGIIKILLEKEIINIKKLNNIYAVSGGSIIGFLILINMDYIDIETYFIKRPWNKLFENKINENLLNRKNISFQEKGILDLTFILKSSLAPLLKSKDLSEEITLLEFYNYSKVKFNIITVNINAPCPEIINLNHETFPNLKLYEAISMSSCIPIIFSPILYQDYCFIDGCYLSSDPLDLCIQDLEKENNNIDSDKIMLLKVTSQNSDKFINIKEENTLFEFCYSLLKGYKKYANLQNSKNSIKNSIIYKPKENSIDIWKEMLYDEKIRENIISEGIKCAQNFLFNN